MSIRSHMNTRTKEWQRRDRGLTARMIFCFLILALLYAIFIGVLAYVGVGFIPIMIVASAMIEPNGISPIR